MAESVLFTGFVGKQLGDGSWKKRLLKITTQAIQFFKTTQNNETLDENYEGSTIVSVSSADSITNKPNTFVVELNSGEGIYCGAENAKAVDSWIKQVQQLMERSNNGNATQEDSEAFSPVPVSSTSVAAPAVAPATVPNVMFPAAIVILISQYSKTFLELLYPLFETQAETVKSSKLYEVICTQIKSNMEKLNLPTHQQQVLLAYLNGNETKEIVQTIVQNRQPSTVLSFLLMDFVEFVQNSVHLPLLFFNQKLVTASTTTPSASTTSPTSSTTAPTVPSSKPAVPSAKPKVPVVAEESTPPVPASKPPRRVSSIDDNNNASSPAVPTKPTKQVNVVEPTDSPSIEMTAAPPIPKSKPPLPPSVLAQKDSVPVDDENAPPVYLDFDSLEKRDKLESFNKTRASVRIKKKSSRNSEGLKDQLSNLEEQAKAESLNEVGSLPAPATPSKRPDPPSQKPSIQVAPEPVVAVQQQSEEPEPQQEQPPQQSEEQTPPPLTRKPTGGIAGGVALFPMGGLPPGGVAALRKSVQIDPNRKPVIPPENEETTGKNSPVTTSTPPLKKASIIKANQQTEEVVTVPDLPNKPAPPPPKKPQATGFFNSPENSDDFVRPTPPSARKPTIPNDEPTNSPPVPASTKKPQFVQNNEEVSSPVPPPSARKPPVPSAKPPTVPSTTTTSDEPEETTPTSEKSTPTPTAVQGGFRLPDLGSGKPLKKAPPVPPEYESQPVTAPVIPKKPAPATTSESAEPEVKQVDFRHMLKKKDGTDNASQPAPTPAPAVPPKVEESAPAAVPPKPVKKAPPVPQPQAEETDESSVKQLDFRGLLKKKEGEEKTATPPPKESSPAPATSVATPPPKPSKPAPAVPPTVAPAPAPVQAPVKDEPKAASSDEVKQVDFRTQLKKKPAEGAPETSNKQATSEEVKQLDFRNVLKKRPE